jgi:F-type H+-transporting ATPase subunit b
MSLISIALIEATEHSGAPAGLVDFADPRLWVFFSLAILVGIVVWKKVPALLAKALDERADVIRAELDKARNLREEAQELLASYERRQREAEKEAEDIVAQARHEAELFAKDAREKLEDVLQRRAETSTRKIAQAEQRATAEVRERAASLASATAKIALEQSLTKTAHNKLISDSIKTLNERL